jgi:pantetheine-phosphate adenylyltransferase
MTAPTVHRARRLCLYPGTFDPITLGHLDVAARAARLFDEVLIAVASSSGKQTTLFSVEERVELIQANLGAIPNAHVTSFDGLLADFADKIGACAILRGLRAISDFEFEFQMALMNRHLKPNLETFFLMPREDLIYTSSSMVKQVARYGGDVSHFVPPNVFEALVARFGQSRH